MGYFQTEGGEEGLLGGGGFKRKMGGKGDSWTGGKWGAGGDGPCNPAGPPLPTYISLLLNILHTEGITLYKNPFAKVNKNAK